MAVHENSPLIRFVLNWETDANDGDFHSFDAQGGHTFYSSPYLRTGGDLYADVTTGNEPVYFTIRGETRRAVYAPSARLLAWADELRLGQI